MLAFVMPLIARSFLPFIRALISRILVALFYYLRECNNRLFVHKIIVLHHHHQSYHQSMASIHCEMRASCFF